MTAVPSRAEADDAERRADALARKGAPAEEIDAADDEAERLHRLVYDGQRP